MAQPASSTAGPSLTVTLTGRTIQPVGQCVRSTGRGIRHARCTLDLSEVSFEDIDLTDSKAFAGGVPHQWFAFLRKNAPVWWQKEANGPGFWAVTSHADCTEVNRDYERFSSARNATYIWELAADDLAQQQMLMLNMDPPLHTRYRRLVNKGFTPRMVNQLHDRINAAADTIIDSVIETGKADFVTDIAAELPLVVIAELLGVRTKIATACSTGRTG